MATGARWSEAEELRESQVRNGLIEYARTKSGKTRAVPISDELQGEIVSHGKAHGSMGRFFGTPFQRSVKAWSGPAWRFLTDK